MDAMTITLLHPGEMGAAIGARLRERGHELRWVDAGRSAASAARARDAGLRAMPSLAAALAGSELVLSVCPPHAARDVARAVADSAALAGFRGIFVDANAIAPASAREIAEIVAGAGLRFVDGGIVGPPPEGEGGRRGARLYLSGDDAPRLAMLLGHGLLDAVALTGPIGQASAIKAAFAAWNKGTIALLATLRAFAVHHDVEAPLLAEWARTDPDTLARLERVPASVRKAWRWSAELDEIARACEDAGLPGGAAAAAAEAYRRLAGFRDATAPPGVEAIVAAMRVPGREGLG